MPAVQFHSADDCYRYYWPLFRRWLVGHMQRRSGPLLTGLAVQPANSLALCTAFLTACFEDMTAKMHTNIDETRFPASYAAALLAEPGMLDKVVRPDLAALTGKKPGVRPARAMGRDLQDYLDHAVVPHCDLSVSMRHTWARIAGISETILRQRQHAPRNETLLERQKYAGSPAHLGHVLDYIVTQHPEDHNLPRSTKTLLKYFETFYRPMQFIGPGDVEVIREFAPEYPELRHCLDVVSANGGPKSAIVDLETSEETAMFKTKADIRAAFGVSRRGYEALFDEVLADLRTCLERRAIRFDARRELAEAANANFHGSKKHLPTADQADLRGDQE